MRVSEVVLSIAGAAAEAGTSSGRVLMHDGVEPLMTGPITAEKVTLLSASEASPADGDIVVWKAPEGDDLSALPSLLGEIPEGATAALILGTPIHELPVGALIDAVLRADMQVRDLAPVQHLGVTCMLVAIRRKSLTAPADYLRTTGGESLDDGALRRIIAEWVVEGTVARARAQSLTQQLQETQRELEQLRAAPVKAAVAPAAKAAATSSSRVAKGLRHPGKAARFVGRKLGGK